VGKEQFLPVKGADGTLAVAATLFLSVPLQPQATRAPPRGVQVEEDYSYVPKVHAPLGSSPVSGMLVQTFSMMYSTTFRECPEHNECLGAFGKIFSTLFKAFFRGKLFSIPKIQLEGISMCLTILV
jgi:hypothetical protein